jgi:sec-independent protein translocase protein TatA
MLARGPEPKGLEMIRGQEILLLFLIVMLLFGAARLPKLARSLREAKDEFQKESQAETPDVATVEAPENEKT